MLETTHEDTGARAYRASTFAAHSLAVERVLHAMRARLPAPLSLDEMAEIAYLSPFHFNRIFRSMTGSPPGEFLAALRLDAAKRLLLTTSLSVTDVCFDLGYASLGTFVTRFKQQVGLSPLLLRQMANSLADTPLQSQLAARSERSEARRLIAVQTHGLHGRITAPGAFSGTIFVGLFPKPIPQGQPVACVTIAAPGEYHFGAIPDGRYYLLAAALPWSPCTLTYLLPGSGLLVAVAGQSVLARDGRVSAPVNLALRPLTSVDPPLLGVFPPLLATPAATRASAFA